MKHKHDRLAFNPSARARLYFDDLIKRMKAVRKLPVTQREAFDKMAELARIGEAAAKEGNLKDTKELNRLHSLESPH